MKKAEGGAALTAVGVQRDIGAVMRRHQQRFVCACEAVYQKAVGVE